MILPEEQYYKLKTYKEVLKLKDDELYKRHPNKENFIKFLLTLPPIPGLVLPTDVLEDEYGIYGYKMPFIKNGITVHDYIDDPFEIDFANITRQLFETLRKVHKYFIIADVRNKNILISSSNSYIIDLENGTKINDETDLFVYYQILIENKKPVIDSPLTDTIKLFISILSLYYGIDIESEFIYTPIFKLKEFLVSAKANPYLLDYLQSLINDIMENRKTPSLDFLQIIDFVKPPSKRERKRLIRTLY